MNQRDQAIQMSRRIIPITVPENRIEPTFPYKIPEEIKDLIIQLASMNNNLIVVLPVPYEADFHGTNIPQEIENEIDIYSNGYDKSKIIAAGLTPLRDLVCPTRIINNLIRYGIYTLEGLLLELRTDPEILFSIKGMGNQSINDLYDSLQEAGYLDPEPIS